MQPFNCYHFSSGHAYWMVVVDVSSPVTDLTMLADGPKTQVGSSVMCQGFCQPVGVPAGAVTVTVMGGQEGG